MSAGQTHRQRYLISWRDHESPPSVELTFTMATKTVLITLALVLSGTYSSHAQVVQSGTLVIVNAAPDEIAVAADSRSLLLDSHSFVDDSCKITVLGNRFVFSASGATAFGSTDSANAWNSYFIAKSVFLSASKKGTPKATPSQLATAWGDQVKEKLRVSLLRDRAHLLSAVDTPGVLATGVFAGIDQDGPWVATATITYTITPAGDVTTSSEVDAPEGLGRSSWDYPEPPMNSLIERPKEPSSGQRASTPNLASTMYLSQRSKPSDTQLTMTLQ